MPCVSSTKVTTESAASCSPCVVSTRWMMGLHTFAPAFSGNEYTGIEDYSHEEISRGLRLLMICSRSAAKSGSSVGCLLIVLVVRLPAMKPVQRW
jgi:hypothetical protein